MMTIGQIKVKDDPELDISVDINDDGFLYIKQGDEWICIPTKHVQDLLKILDEAPIP